MKHAALACLVWLGLAIPLHPRPAPRSASAPDMAATSGNESVLAPGAILTLRFPELGPMQDNLPAACEISVPSNYDPARPVPLLVWFGGGSGSHRVDGARGVVDFERFVVAALPYPDGRGPRVAAEELRVEEHWAYHRVMLARILALLPNLDSRIRIAAGTSNGAHYIAYGLDQQWPGFGEAFTAFVLHEGGSAPLGSRIPGAKGRRILVAWGTRSESIRWREWFNDRIAVVGADVTFVPVPGSGHGLDDQARQALRRWTDGLVASAPSPDSR